MMNCELTFIPFTGFMRSMLIDRALIEYINVFNWKTSYGRCDYEYYFKFNNFELDWDLLSSSSHMFFSYGKDFDDSLFAFRIYKPNTAPSTGGVEVFDWSVSASLQSCKNSEQWLHHILPKLFKSDSKGWFFK